MAVAARARGEDRHAIAVIGDGAMSAGMAFEALNNAGDMENLNLLVILNDNEMSISPPVGALTKILARMMSGSTYNTARRVGEKVLGVAPPVAELARKVEEYAKGMIGPGTLFEEFGFHYYGPIDGHDLDALIPTLQNLRKLKGPQFLHVITRKGQGYKLAEADPVLYHGVSKFDHTAGIQPARAAASSPTPRCSATGCATWPRPTRASSASPRRCARAPAWCASRRSSPSATSTSASPSSTR
jgi:1-deoxy-D-xylulose-5-phosphate synthase